MNTKKKFICVLLAFLAGCGLLAGLLFFNAISAQASTNTDGMWQNGQTQNLIPAIQSVDTWDTLVAKGWGKDSGTPALSVHETDGYGYGVRPSDTGSGADIGNHDYTGGIYYTIVLSEADRVKAAAGQLSVSASAWYYRQATASVDLSLRAEFHTESGSDISIAKVTSTNGGDTPINLTLEKTQIPATTAYIEMWFSNSKSLFQRPWIADMQTYLHDSTPPAFESAILNDAQITDPENKIAIEGDTVQFFIRFNEKVSVAESGRAALDLNGQQFVTSSEASAIDENGKTSVGYTFTLPESQKSGTLSLASVSGLKVKDEAGNEYTYSASPSAGTLQYYGTMSVTPNLLNLEMVGSQTAQFNTDYTAVLRAAEGYDLPSSVTVTVGNIQLANDAYTYDSVSGNLTIYGSYIKGDIAMTAAGIAKRSAVTFDKQNGSGGTDTVTAVYNGEMPAVIVPTRTGYTFAGYYTQSGGNAVQYYDESGKSVKKCDFYLPLTLYAHWIANEYTVEFNGNKPENASGAVSGMTASTSHTYDAAKALTANGFALTGWTFCGWATERGGAAVYDDGESVVNLTAENGAAVQLYAVWKANSHTIELNATGGSNSGSVTAIYDSVLPDIPAVPARYGYNFVGYFDAKTDGVQYYGSDGKAVEKTFAVDDNLVLYAQWSPVTYTIEFYSEGNYLGTREGIAFGELNLPSAEELSLSRKNFEFVGWNLYDEQNWAMYRAETTYSVGLTGEQDGVVVVYAAWQEKPIRSLFYDANGGYGAPATTQAHEEESIVLSEAVPVRKNYTFLGWAASADSQTAQYRPGGEFTMGSAVVTLYAVWKHNPSLRYDANGGTLDGSLAVSYPAAGETIVITILIPELDGSVFKGWSEDAGSGTADYLSGKEFIMPETDTVLYAVWEIAQYTVTSEVAEGYAIEGLHEKYFFNETASFCITGTSPKVYIDGKLATAGENGVYSFSVRSDTHIFVTDSSELSLIYSANGGSGAPSDHTAYHAGSEATVTSVQPVREGYDFIGWSENENAKTADYTAGGTVLFAEKDIVLYAVWQGYGYTVAYQANGGTGAMDSDVFVYGTEKPLSKNTFEKEGHTFVGWALSETGESVYGDGAAVLNLCAENNGNITLYAVWERTVTVITFVSEEDSKGNAPVSVAYGEVLSSEGLMIPVRAGYRFTGYYTQTDGEGEAIFDAEMNVAVSGAWNVNTSALTLYANWTPVAYTIVYRNGQQTAGEQAAVYGTPFRLRSVTELGIVAPEGYHFAGWSATPSGQVAAYTDGQTIFEALTQTDNDIIYLYAVFEENDIRITYEANGGSNAPVDNNAYFTGDTAYLSDLIPEREGYVFAGWSYDPNGDSPDFPFENGQFTVDFFVIEDRAVTLYAVWRAGDTLQAQIDRLQEQAASLANAIDGLKNADSEFSVELTRLGEELKAAQDAVAALNNTYATDAELADAVDQLKELLSDAETNLGQKIANVQADLGAATEALTGAIAATKADLEGKLAAVDAAYKAADALLDSDIAALQGKDGELAQSIAALDAAYKAADEILWASIRQLQGNLDAIEQENGQISLTYMIVNLVLGGIAAVLILTLMIKVLKKKPSQK